MSDMNFCSGLVIEQINLPDPFGDMYLLQQRLQLRLNKDAYTNVTAHTMAKNCIYWFYCIANECKELIDWFDPKNHSGLPELEVRAEIAMESIDIIHFVMNIGLELRFTAKEIAEFEANIVLVPRQLLAVNADEANTILIDKCVALIDVMPWKTWKTYPNDITVADVKDLVADDYKEVYIACLRLCTSVGLDRQDIVNIYFAKNKENHNRQDNGY